MFQIGTPPEIGFYRVREILKNASKQKSGCKIIDDGKYPAKNQDTDKQSSHCKTIPSQPIEISVGALFTHEQHDDGTAIQWRNRKKIKHAKKQVEREKYKENVRE